MAPTLFNISKAAGDTRSVSMDHQQEMAYGVSHGHVNDDANVFGAHYLDIGWRYGLGANGAPISYDYLGSNGHVTDDVT